MLSSPTKPVSASPSSSPEPSSSPNSLLNGKLEVRNQNSTMSTAAALNKITNFSIAAIMHQQSQNKLRNIESSEEEDDLRAKRRRFEHTVPTLGR